MPLRHGGRCHAGLGGRGGRAKAVEVEEVGGWHGVRIRSVSVHPLIDARERLSGDFALQAKSKDFAIVIFDKLDEFLDEQLFRPVEGFLP